MGEDLKLPQVYRAGYPHSHPHYKLFWINANHYSWGNV